MGKGKNMIQIYSMKIINVFLKCRGQLKMYLICIFKKIKKIDHKMVG